MCGSSHEELPRNASGKVLKRDLRGEADAATAMLDADPEALRVWIVENVEASTTGRSKPSSSAAATRT